MTQDDITTTDQSNRLRDAALDPDDADVIHERVPSPQVLPPTPDRDQNVHLDLNDELYLLPPYLPLVHTETSDDPAEMHYRVLLDALGDSYIFYDPIDDRYLSYELRGLQEYLITGTLQFAFPPGHKLGPDEQ